MLFRLFYDQQLAQASYLIGCQATGEAIVVDPLRDVLAYRTAAAQEGLEITAITETHIHADFVSGARELSALTGATMHLSDAGPAEWKYGFRAEPRVKPLLHGTQIAVGNIVLEAVHTPGHTPEHMSFLVTDGASSTEPMGILTGDFVFVGDVGRPDLLEKAARVEGASEGSARQLFESLRWFKGLPAHWQVWPGHGAGSACGKGIGAVPQSTVGYELRTNWALSIELEEDFVRQVLQGQPEPPAYFAVMKYLNRDGPAVLGEPSDPPPTDLAGLEQHLGDGGVVVDTRTADQFAAGHIPGCVNIPFNRAFATSAGSILPYDRDLILLLQDPATLGPAVRSLRLIGLDRVTGRMGPDALAEWARAGHALGELPQVSAADVAARTGSGYLLDVRGETEWAAGHIPGAHLIPLPELAARITEVPQDRPVLVHCQGGSRSAIAASLLLARGWPEVANLTGGFAAWLNAGRPTTAD